ncbi:MAG: ribonuclease E activity regulator RraA [Pseudomonadales bacterium]
MKISTPDLCDAHEHDVTVLEPLFGSFGGREAFGGQVVTVKCFEDNSAVKAQLATEGHGRVLVVDGGGSLRRALMGDLIAASAVQNGWSGVVIYGAIRDVDEIAAMDLGVHAMGTIPLKTERRGLGDVGVTLKIAGAVIQNGDYLYADNNGIIVSSKALI